MERTVGRKTRLGAIGIIAFFAALTMAALPGALAKIQETRTVGVIEITCPGRIIHPF